MKSDKLYLEIGGWQSGFEFELESVPYDIKVGCEAETDGKFSCDFKLKDNQTGRQEFMNVEVSIQGDEVTVTLRSSIDGFENVQATGTKQVCEVKCELHPVGRTIVGKNTAIIMRSV